MKKYLKFIFIGFGILIVFLIIFYHFNPLRPKVRLNGQIIYLDIAMTPEQTSRGLSYRPHMNQNEGMLFIFGNKDIRPFWMFQMHFPLDFLWLDGNKIVDLSKNVPVITNGSWTVVNSKIAFDRVMELNAGIIDKLHIKVGDKLKYY